jgi:hypothetical protein
MLRSILVAALLGSITSPAAFAQQNEPKPVPKPPHKVPRVPKPPHEIPIIDGDEIQIGAKNRKVLLMTFLERASEELERASLQKRSFIPELIKTVDAETL